MYVMVALLFGSLLVGFVGRFRQTAQTRLALAASIAATIIYLASQRAM
jgi:hypothetical protein